MWRRCGQTRDFRFRIRTEVGPVNDDRESSNARLAVRMEEWINERVGARKGKQMALNTIITENLLIAGQRVPAADGKTFDTYNPATGDVLARLAEAGLEDVDRAVAAARKAFEGPWSRLSAAKRGRLLQKAAQRIRDRLEEL